MSLINELQNKPRYPVRLGFLGGYFFGAPWFQSDRVRSLLDMAVHAQRTVDAQHGQASAEEREWLTTVGLVAMLDGLLDSITTKSAGLMQALSILAALLTIVITQASNTNLLAGIADDVFSYVTLAVTLFATLLLFANVSLATRRQQGFFTEPKLLIEETYAIVLSRAGRLRIAQWLAFASFLAVFFATLYLAGVKISQTFGPITFR